MKDLIPWKLVWLASYPKSGNTWFRVFITNYLRNAATPAMINELEPATIASARQCFDAFYGIDSADLDFNEIDARRPAMYQQWQDNNASSGLFHKVHDAYTYLSDGQPLLGNPQQQAAIYFIRNPLDVVISASHYLGTDDFDHVIAQMNNSEACANGNNIGFSSQLRQKFLTWSQHVSSWLQAPLPKLIVRYEDMMQDSLNTFSRIIKFLGLENNVARIERAIRLSHFATLQEQEQTFGFQEKLLSAKVFFRRGEVNGYPAHLSDEQIKRVIAAHRDIMEQFAYV